MASTPKFELLQNEYIEWTLMNKHQRAIAGLPTSDIQWAKIKGITDRAIRKWKQNPDFLAKLENRQREVALALPGATALPLQVSTVQKQNVDMDKNEHEGIKAKLIERALAGDRASAELYFKTYGKQFVDEEIASRKSDFRDLDTDALYERVLSLVPVEKIREALEKRELPNE